MPVATNSPFIGVMPHLERAGGMRAWMDPELRWEVRNVILLADWLYQQASEGQARAQVTRLRSQEPPYSFGVAADLSLEGLPGVSVLIPGLPAPPIAEQICEAINLNFPFGDGTKETARADGAAIHIQVPVRGYTKVANCLAEWPRFGATGHRRHWRLHADGLEAPVAERRYRSRTLGR